MEKYTYKKSGVNLENAGLLSKILTSRLNSSNFTNFAGVFEHSALPEYLLAATTDGIGTKLIPLLEKKMYKTMAIDLAAMNLNDLACACAKPLFFLDYIAANTLNPDEISNCIIELDRVLKDHNCLLIGGETSELGDFIKEGLFDIAGFAVGLASKNTIIKKELLEEGDIIIGLKSSGVHSNGFSLVRKLYNDGKLSETNLLKTLEPTAIYINEILSLCQKKLTLGLCNITGGGILSNLKRCIPKGYRAILDKKALPKIEIFETLKSFVSEEEMFHTFNMGAGFCIIAKEKDAREIFDITKIFSPFVFGRIEKLKEGNNIATAEFES